MNKTILIIIILAVLIFGYFVWPTPYQYNHTVQNILVRINRLTGETYYFIPGEGQEKGGWFITPWISSPWFGSDVFEQDKK